MNAHKGVLPESSFTQRCPKCKKATCQFEPDTSSIKCGSCGYEVKLTI